jgi:hypothetical protein
MVAQIETIREFFDGFLGIDGRPSRPDGRPIYGYRSTVDELEVLSGPLARAIRCPGLSRAADQAAGAFALYAAEWWRRSYAGGPWAWDGVFEALGVARPVYPEIHEGAQRGLRWWNRRSVLLGGREMLLASLACEGGLPLGLLDRHGTWIRDYLHALLEDLRIYGKSGAEPPDELAELAARRGERLPATLRRAPVYRLCGLLAGKVWALRQEVDEIPEGDPIQWFDRHRPGWRDELPLRLEDRSAGSLLRGLVSAADRLSRGATTRLRGRVQLFFDEAGAASLRRTFALPGRIEEAALEQTFEIAASVLPRRARLVVRVPTRTAPLDLATVVREAGGSSRWRLSDSRAAGLEGQEATEGCELRLVSAATAPAIAHGLRGMSELTELPWIFASAGEEESWELVGQGRCRRREPRLLAALPRGWHARLAAVGEVEDVGALEACARRLVRLSGAVRLHGDRQAFTVVAEAPRDEVCTLRPRGQRLELDGLADPPWLGFPRVVAHDGDGHSRELRQSHPDLLVEGGSSGPDPVGAVRVRYQAGGEVRAEVKLVIVPRDLAVKVRPTTQRREGTIEVSSRQLEAVGLDGPVEDQDGQAATRDPAGGWVIRCPLLEMPPARVTLHLRFGGGAEVKLVLPYPQAVGRFETTSGATLSEPASVDLLGCGSVRAVARSSDLSEQWLLEARVLMKDRRLQAHWNLPSDGDGAWALDLRDLREDLERLLGAAGTLDTQVELRLVRLGITGRWPRLSVRRYDRMLRPDREAEAVELSAAVDDGWVVARHLLAPADGEEQLTQLAADGDKPRWSFPLADREPGPWLISVESELGSESRPLLWTVPGDSPEDSPLRAAICCPVEDERFGLLRSTLLRLAEVPEDPDWALVLDTLGLFERLPSSSFDLSRALLEEPRALALALLYLPAEQLRPVVDGLSELPHLWELVPVDAWSDALRTMGGLLESQVGDRGLALTTLGTLVSRIAEEGSPVLLAAAELGWAGAMDLADDLRETSDHLVRGLPESILTGLFQQEWSATRRRHAGDERWPAPRTLRTAWEGPLGQVAPANRNAVQRLWSKCSGEPGYVRDVHNAPLLAAGAAATGAVPDARIRFTLRQCRDFDPDWFDFAFKAHLSTVRRLARETS